MVALSSILHDPCLNSLFALRELKIPVDFSKARYRYVNVPENFMQRIASSRDRRLDKHYTAMTKYEWITRRFIEHVCISNGEHNYCFALAIL